MGLCNVSFISFISQISPVCSIRNNSVSNWFTHSLTHCFDLEIYIFSVKYLVKCALCGCSQLRRLDQKYNVMKMNLLNGKRTEWHSSGLFLFSLFLCCTFKMIFITLYLWSKCLNFNGTHSIPFIIHSFLNLPFQWIFSLFSEYNRYFVISIGNFFASCNK